MFLHLKRYGVMTQELLIDFCFQSITCPMRQAPFSHLLLNARRCLNARWRRGVDNFLRSSRQLQQSKNHKRNSLPPLNWLAVFSAFTYYTGFKVNSGEYKVMGLAPYGEPRFVDLIKDNLIDICEDGSFQLDMSYFDYSTGLRMTNAKFDRLLGGPARHPESELTQREMDLAASVQKVTEEVCC